MAIQWYFERDGKQFGPYLAARLKELAAGGEVRPQDLVWKEGMGKGVLASRVARLFAPAEVSLAPAETSVEDVAEAACPGPAATLNARLSWRWTCWESKHVSRWTGLVGEPRGSRLCVRPWSHL